MLRLTQIPQTFRNLNRFREIIQVVVKHGFGDVVSRLGIDSLINSLTLSIRRQSPTSHKTEVRIRLAIEDLGATFIKLGQILATRPDLIPMPLVKELRKLQDDCKPVEITKIRRLLEQELGRPPEEVFENFSETPLAAASIGQVHRAKMVTGEEVVLKVQRPGLEQQIETDLSIMRWFAELVHENVAELRRYDPIGIVNEFEVSLLKEVDFGREASHIKRFARNFDGDDRVYVPTVFESYSTDKVLVEEFIIGEKADSEEICALDLATRKTIAENGISCILKQVFVHGFFHADPHPGNIFIVNRRQVCFIDYGMMGVLDDERIDEMLEFLVAVLTRNAEAVVRLFSRLDLIPEEVNKRVLRTDLLDLLERYGSLELQKLDVGLLISDVFDVITRHDIKLPSDLLLVGKALATIDGVARAIYPELEPLETIRPKILEIYIKRLTDPKRLARQPRRIAENFYDLLQSFPEDARMALRRLRSGDLLFNARFSDAELHTKTFDRAVNRLSISLVIAAFVLAGSVLLAQSDFTVVVGYPEVQLKTLAGLVFLGLGATYGLVLLIGFFRSDGV